MLVDSVLVTLTVYDARTTSVRGSHITIDLGITLFGISSCFLPKEEHNQICVLAIFVGAMTSLPDVSRPSKHPSD